MSPVALHQGGIGEALPHALGPFLDVGRVNEGGPLVLNAHAVTSSSVPTPVRTPVRVELMPQDPWGRGTRSPIADGAPTDARARDTNHRVSEGCVVGRLPIVGTLFIRPLSMYNRHVVCDPALLREATQAKERLIDAEHDVDAAQADFNRAVRRLQLEGASLREIAAALGISHQRVHQIVDAAGGSRPWRKSVPEGPDSRHCSFCGGIAGKARKLIAGPGVHICQRCVPAAATVIEAGTPVTTPTATINAVDETSRRERCSFCGKARHEVGGLASAGETRICVDCVRLCEEILAEELA